MAISIAVYGSTLGHFFKNSLVWNFDTPTDRTELSQFLASESTSGDAGNWTILPDATAPSPPNVLARLPGNQSESSYHLLVMPNAAYQTNFKASLKFKVPLALKGQEAVGLIFRLQDGSHYFVLMADYNMQKVSLCRAEPGTMLCLQDQAANITADTWHTITAGVSSEGIAGYLDDKQLFKRYDQHYQQGTVGVLAKGNSKAYFDDLSMEY